MERREIRENLWDAQGDLWKLESRRWSVLIRMPLYYARLLTRLLLAPAGDVYLVTYPGWFDVPAVWLVARLKRKPLVFDPFISLWDTVVGDRELAGKRSVVARALLFIDRLALRLADHVVGDTDAHLRMYAGIAGRSLKGFVLPVGSDEAVFRPTPEQRSDQALVAFYGTYVPLQGVETIVRAAERLPAVNFRLIGGGQGRTAAEYLIGQLKLENVELVDAVPYAELPALLSPAAICLGIFGASAKAGNVVPHKVYDYLAMGKPVITRGSAALEEMGLADAVVTVPPCDSAALADAIGLLLDDEGVRGDFAQKGREVFQQRYSSEHLTEELRVFLFGVASAR